MPRRDIGSELVAAIAAVAVLAFALVFGVLLNLSSSGRPGSAAAASATAIFSPEIAATATPGLTLSTTRAIPSEITATWTETTALAITDTVTVEITATDKAATATATDTTAPTRTKMAVVAATPTEMLTVTASPTLTATLMPSHTLTVTATSSSTATVSPSATKTPPVTATATVTASMTATATKTETATATLTPTSTSTVTVIQPTLTATAPVQPSATPTHTSVSTHQPATPAITTGVTPAQTTLPSGTIAACTPPSDWQRYLLQPGDTLSSVADSADSTVQEISRVNCIFNVDGLLPGDVLYLPRLPVITRTPEAEADSLPMIGCESPEIAIITDPEPGQQVEGSIRIIGTAAVTDFWYYRLEIRPDDRAGFDFYLRSQTSVSDGELGTLQADLLPTGIYWLRLTVVRHDNTILVDAVCVIPIMIK